MNNRWCQIARVERIEKIKQAKNVYALFTLPQEDFSDKLNALKNAIINVAKAAHKWHEDAIKRSRGEDA